MPVKQQCVSTVGGHSGDWNIVEYPFDKEKTVVVLFEYFTLAAAFCLLVLTSCGICLDQHSDWYSVLQISSPGELQSFTSGRRHTCRQSQVSIRVPAANHSSVFTCSMWRPVSFSGSVTLEFSIVKWETFSICQQLAVVLVIYSKS